MMKKVYIGAMRLVGRIAKISGIVGFLEARSDNRWAHWLLSLLTIHDVEAMAALDCPWWSYDAIEYVEGWLLERNGVRAFEWGAGASSMWLSTRVSTLTAVEHHLGFADVVQEMIPSNVNLLVIEPHATTSPEFGSRKPGHAGLDFASYVNAIDTAGGPFDLISIDGRAREACLAAAVNHLAPGGMIVFDNTDRARYKQAIEKFEADFTSVNLRGLTPALPFPSTTTLLTRK